MSDQYKALKNAAFLVMHRAEQLHESKPHSQINKRFIGCH